MYEIRTKPHGIMFHHFTNEVHCAGQGALSADQFARMIDFLGRDRILSAGEWMERSKAGALTDADLCLTFDDTLLCQYDIALPVLERYGIKAFWFVYSSVLVGGVEKLEVYRKFRTVHFPDPEAFYVEFLRTLDESKYGTLAREKLEDFVPEEYIKQFTFYTKSDRTFRYLRDKVLGPQRYQEIMDAMMERRAVDVPTFSRDLWMNKEHLRRLKDAGHVVGMHSHTHPMDLAALPLDVQRTEYKTNFSVLKDALGEAPRSVSYPCNSCDDATLSIMRELGITTGFRAYMKDPLRSTLEYPREDHIKILQAMDV